MTGLEAIFYHNGFAMAAVGITIVFTALVSLSLIISQLHRALFVWDNRRSYIKKALRLFSEPKPPESEPVVKYFDNIYESARQFNLLIRATGEPFSLPELIRTAETRGIAHAHSTVSHLIAAGLIVGDGRGYFRWNREAYEQLLRQEPK
ncbi:MAG: hypothetical protein K9K62_02580 [Desulfobacteraceae bacterium]|nr:hypothetical protein [Desulfobacteraceae bacterium]